MKIQPSYIGYHKSIEQLNPVLFFTFDVLETIVSKGEIQGIFLSRTENDYGELEIHNTGFIENMHDKDVLTESLVDSEKTANNRSFYASQNLYNNLIISILQPKQVEELRKKWLEEFNSLATQYVGANFDFDRYGRNVIRANDFKEITTIKLPMNNLSASGNFDLDIDKDNYSFTFQTKIIPQDVQTHDLPYFVNSNNISSTIGMGFSSKTVIHDYLDFNLNISFGFSSMHDNAKDEYRDNKMNIGFTSHCNLDTIEKDNSLPPQFSQFRKIYEEKNKYNLTDTLYFSFGHFRLNLPITVSNNYFEIETYDIEVKDDYEDWYDQYIGEKNEKTRNELLDELSNHHKYVGFDIAKKVANPNDENVTDKKKMRGIIMPFETNTVGEKSEVIDVRVFYINKIRIQFRQNLTFFFNVNKTHLFLFLNGVYCGAIKKSNWTNKLQIGQKSKKIFVDRDPITDTNYFKISYPRYEMMFDNFAVFNERLKKYFIAYLYSITEIVEQKLALYGFNNVVNFHNYHHKNRFGNREEVKSLFGRDFLRVVHCENERYNHPIQTKDNSSNDFRTYLTCHYGVGIESNDFYTPYDFYTENGKRIELFQYPKPLINFKERGVIMFYFRTTENNVMLFHNGADYIEQKTTRLVLEDNYLWFYANGTKFAVKDPKKVKERFRWTILNYENLNDGEWHRIAIDYRYNGVYIFVDDELSEFITGDMLPRKGTTKFGFSLPGHENFKIDYTYIAYSRSYIRLAMLQNMTRMLVSYEMNGIVTLNNIPVGTDLFICDRETGELIEHIIVDNKDGKFSLKTNDARTLSIIAKNPKGESFILDPIELR